MSINKKDIGIKKIIRQYTIASNKTSKEFGKVDVIENDSENTVQATILMEPQGTEAEGWQTGVAIDSSASMKDWFGQRLLGKIPEDIEKQYKKKKWIEEKSQDGRKVKVFQKEAFEDAINKGILKYSPNIVEPIARDFLDYLSSNLDADGGTTLLYWAAGREGSEIEIIGDITQKQCSSLNLKGAKVFGGNTILLPAVKYFIERFQDAKRGMYIFITDGKIEDLEDVKKYTIDLAREIENGKRNYVKCVLIGVGDEIDENQMEELDNIDTGTRVDIWDHKISKEMRDIKEIFAEVVDENTIVASNATVYDSNGEVIKKYTDDLPAKISFTINKNSDYFELDVGKFRIKQFIK